MRDLAELQMLPRRRNPFPPASDQQLDEFESHFAVKLPLEFRQFLMNCNGGRTSVCEYVDHTGLCGVNDFHGLGTRSADDAQARDGSFDVGNLWGETRVHRPHVGERGVPFARDAGSNQLFLDYVVDPPRVSRLIASTRQSYVIAESFGQFIDMLQPEEDLPRRRRS